MIIIECKDAVAEQMMANELMKHKGVKIKVFKESISQTVEVHYSAKAMGQLGDIYTIDASKNVTKLAEALGVKDGWKKPVKVGGLYASLNSDDRLAFFSNERDYHPDEDRHEGAPY